MKEVTILFLTMILILSGTVSAKNNPFYINEQNTTGVSYVAFNEFTTPPQIYVENLEYAKYVNVTVNNGILDIQIQSTSFSYWIGVRFLKVMDTFAGKEFSYIMVDVGIDNVPNTNCYYNVWVISPDNVIKVGGILKSSVLAVKTAGYPSLIVDNTSSGVRTVNYTPAKGWNNETFIFNNGEAYLYINGTLKLSTSIPYKSVIFQKLIDTSDEYEYVTNVYLNHLRVLGVRNYSNVSLVL